MAFISLSRAKLGGNWVSLPWASYSALSSSSWTQSPTCRSSRSPRRSHSDPSHSDCRMKSPPCTLSGREHTRKTRRIRWREVLRVTLWGKDCCLGGHTQHEEEARQQPGPEVDGDGVVWENRPGTTVPNQAWDPLHGITITSHQI